MKTSFTLNQVKTLLRLSYWGDDDELRGIPEALISDEGVIDMDALERFRLLTDRLDSLHKEFMGDFFVAAPPGA